MTRKPVAYNYNEKGELLLTHLHVREGVYYARKRVDGRQPMLSLGIKVVGADPAKVHAALLAMLANEDAWAKTKKSGTLREFWDGYHIDYVAGQQSPRMVKIDGQRVVKKKDDGTPSYRIENDMVFILARHGHRPLTDFTEDRCREFVRERRTATYEKGGHTRPYAANTLTREFVTLKSVFAMAVKQGRLDRNPWDNVDTPGGYTPAVVFLTHEEQAKIEEELTPSMARWLNFMIGTGLRCFEGDALLPAHINLEKRYIEVLRKSRRSAPKVQRVPILFDAVVETIRVQLEREGTMWNKNYSSYWRLLNSAARRAGITKPIGVHTLRHTFATRYLQERIGDIYRLSKILGHTSVKTTERTYVHLVHEDLLPTAPGGNIGLTLPPSSVTNTPATVLPFEKKSAETA